MKSTNLVNNNPSTKCAGSVEEPCDELLTYELNGGNTTCYDSFMESIKDKHPKSYKHYAMTFSVNSLVNVLDGLDPTFSKVMTYLGKHSRCTYIHETSEHGKLHIHGILSTRYAVKVKAVHQNYPGIQLYLTKMKHPSVVSKGAIDPSLLVYNKGKACGIICGSETYHPFLGESKRWVAYCVKSGAYENKEIKYYRVT